MEFPTCYCCLGVIYMFQSYRLDLGQTMNILFAGFAVDTCRVSWTANFSQ